MKISADALLAEGVRVLKGEAQGLEALAGTLGENFVRAVELLGGAEGRVAVTGMGKSGHVARKVAATMASTGTPAYFIHPAEAAHGDLGMLSLRDVLLAYSNSGETAELGSLLDFCARGGLPVIGVTKNPHSTLAAQSAVALILPNLPEACPFDSAPTTSTTMMMALGDALALGLIQAKGFSEEQFHLYHPGGHLGRKLMSVRDIMHSGDEIPLVTRAQAMPEVLYTITGKSFGCTGVVDESGALIGVITDGDLRRHMKADFLTLTAGDIMTPNPVTIQPDTLSAKALGMMQRRAITTVFVVEEGAGAPAGILHIHDCLRAGLA
ncbi:MAG: KpsF/GutQ family sugar-phosphate isomerase [Candidatus Adiutrix sp.]|nr:KpsF/GutQ family sugar-phosphate isomerase [Candidatus Adiutrix sp.]